METSADVVVGSELRAGRYRVREISYPPGYAQPAHGHSHASVTILLSGSLRERSGTEVEEASCLSVVAKPVGVEHADTFGPEGARTLQIAFDPEAALDARERARVLPRWRWRHGGVVARPLLAVWRALRDGGPDGPAELEDRVLAALDGIAGDAPPASAPPGWLALAREALDDTLPDHVPIRRLAGLAGVHPVSLSRAFRRHYGCSITDYRKRERLWRAAARLRGTQRDVARIAHATGYADHAHLCRDFREATGLTPSEFRRLAGSA